MGIEMIYEACQEAGIPILSLDKCCRLLAIVYVMGGSMEAFTHNTRLVAEWRYAQHRCNIYEGRVPDKEALTLIRKYVSELESYYEGRSSETEHPRWVMDIMARYGIHDMMI
jgi:hypothetical protein